MGNYHAQFLGGLGAAMPPGYPVLLLFGFLASIPKILFIAQPQHIEYPHN
jgi:hypothetical protein